MKNNQVEWLKIRSETVDVPPPYAHHYGFEIQFQETMFLRFFLTYEERDSITEEEIIDEGFTLEDDFSWEGTLPEAWRNTILKLLAATTFTTDSPQFVQQQLQLGNNRQDPSAGIYPTNQQEWIYLSQEMIQAVLELSNREAPLVIRYLKLDEEDLGIDLTQFFGDRHIEIEVNKNGIHRQEQVSWDLTKELIRAIYTLDYAEDRAVDKPRKKGAYLDLGMGWWYELGKSATNPHPKRDLVSQIKHTFEEIVDS